MWERQAVTGWDEKSQRLVGFAFDADGRHQEDVTEITDENTFVIRSRLCMPNGETGTSAVIVKRVDADTCTTQQIELSIGGVSQPSQEVMTFKRVK